MPGPGPADKPAIPMNASRELVRSLDRATLRRLHGARGVELDTGELRRRVGDRYAGDLAGLLNRLRRSGLEPLATEQGLSTEGAVGELRARMWMWGAELEAGGREHLGTALQPVPVVLGGALVVMSAEPGTAPPAPAYPRPIPPPRAAEAPADEPETLEDLLAVADTLLGVRLGAARRHKGAYGVRIAELLGVPERGHSEPDWRGEVEIKTVPVVRDRSGFWRIKEDPAVSMEHAAPAAKLARVLWVARVADDPGSPILSWFYQERTATLARLFERYLHTRPKGGAGATTRGWYVQKRFFARSGLLQSLNG